MEALDGNTLAYYTVCAVIACAFCFYIGFLFGDVRTASIPYLRVLQVYWKLHIAYRGEAYQLANGMYTALRCMGIPTALLPTIHSEREGALIGALGAGALCWTAHTIKGRRRRKQDAVKLQGFPGSEDTY